MACCEGAIAQAQSADDHVTRGKAHYVLCKESMWVSRFAEGLEHVRRAVGHLERTGECWWPVAVLAGHKLLFHTAPAPKIATPSSSCIRTESRAADAAALVGVAGS